MIHAPEKQIVRPLNSASNLHRRKQCPGSARMEKGLSDEKSEEASEGDLLHAAIADEKSMFVLTKDQTYCVEFYKKTIEELMVKVFGADKPKVFREIELELDGAVFGHSDFVAVWKDQAVCIDAKFGRIAVETADANIQTRAYAVMIAERFGVSHVMAGIIQPRLAAEERVSLSQYGPEDIEKAKSEILSVLAACEAPGAPLRPEIDACRYCRAKATCPALVGEADELITVPLAEIKLDNCAEVYRRCKIVEKHLDAIKSAVFCLVQNAEAENRHADGITLKAGAKKRTITDAEKAFLVLNIPSEKFLPHCTVSITGIEEEYKIVSGLKAKDAKISMEALLTVAGALEIKHSSPSLVLTKK